VLFRSVLTAGRQQSRRRARVGRRARPRRDDQAGRQTI